MFGAKGQAREAYLKRSTGDSCQTLSIGDPWKSDSPVKCYSQCMVRFPKTCASIVYNPKTKSCTPGSTAFGRLDRIDIAIPDQNSGDKIYYVKQPIPPCNASDGFSLYELCGTTACLHLSSAPQVDYTDAKLHCDVLDSRLFIGNTWARFSLFWNVSLGLLQANTWIGLTDIAEEGKFVWDNGEKLSDEQYKYIWLPSKPNQVNEEDCVEARHEDKKGVFGLNDEECWKVKHYICEPL